MLSKILVPTVVLTAACATDDGHGPVPRELQMNDVSVLLPLARSQAELDAMPSPTTPGKTGVLLPETLFAQDTNDGPIQYGDLHVVAFRLDPCFGTTDPIGEPDKCESQLRLVFQPLRLDSVTNAAVADDAAVHVFYKLTREELIAAATDIVDARLGDGVTTDLGALAVHPTISAEGVTGPLATRFAQIIAKYAGQDNIVKVTSFVFLAVNEGVVASFDQFWTLHGNDVVAGHFQPIEIAGMPPKTTEIDLDVIAQPLATRSSPAPEATDDLTLLANFSAAMASSPLQRQAAFDAALRIENPHDHTPNTTDCGSCHIAQHARELVGDALGMHEAGNPNAFVPDASLPLADLAHTTHAVSADGGVNIHAFSYRGREPMINQRVINETASIVVSLGSQVR
jgi:hypothetical protein